MPLFARRSGAWVCCGAVLALAQGPALAIDLGGIAGVRVAPVDV